MTTPQVFQVLALLLSAAAFVVSVATFIRNGRWRDSDEAKALIKRIEHAENWGDSAAAKALIDKIDDHGKRLAAGEERFRNLATRADIAEVRAEVRGLEKAVDKVDGAVIRIEKILTDRNT